MNMSSIRFVMTCPREHNTNMLRRVIATLCLLVVFIPTSTWAARSADELYRDSLLRLIELLTAQIQLLEAELRTREISEVSWSQSVRFRIDDERQSSMGIDDLLPSRFYDGEYVALYETNGTELLPIGDTRERFMDTELWNRYVRLLGQERAKSRIQEFRLYRATDANYDAFTDRDTRTGKWVIGLNTYGIDLEKGSDRIELDILLLHESGHVILEDIEGMVDNFRTTFWDTDDIAHAERVALMSPGAHQRDIIADYYARNRDRFVSEYAAMSPLEDLVESYVEYLRNDAPTGSTERDEKVRYFDRFAELAEERERINRVLDIAW